MSQTLRILYSILCLVAAVWFPYWLLFVLVLVGYILFDWYIEGVLAILLADILYGVPLARFYHLLLPGTLIGAFVFALVEIGKRFIRYGSA